MENIENKNTKISCEICPRKCSLAPGQFGFCKTRFNNGEKIISQSNGYSSGFAIDPIEKKPLYHFYPTSTALSFGTFGCNMGCNFCQNYHISKIGFAQSKAFNATPEQIVNTAIKYNCKSIAYTYNDPVVSFEYTIETAKTAKENNIKNVAVTAGYISSKYRKTFFENIDAANIDLKAFSEDFYKKNCLAHINPVLDTIRYVWHETDTELELTTLLIPNENDDEEQLKREFEWIASNLSTDIPIHLSAFHPAYRMSNKERTSVNSIINAYNIAKEFELKYVYSGNIIDDLTSATSCPKCKYKLIERNGYNVRLLTENPSVCPNCREKIYGRF